MAHVVKQFSGRPAPIEPKLYASFFQKFMLPPTNCGCVRLLEAVEVWGFLFLERQDEISCHGRRWYRRIERQSIDESPEVAVRGGVGEGPLEQLGLQGQQLLFRVY